MDNKAFFAITYGLFTLITYDGARTNACIVNTFGEVTTTPRQATVTVNKANYSCETLLKTSLANVCVLPETAGFEDVFKRFGFQSGRDNDKMQGVSMQIADNGLAYLADCVCYFSLKVLETKDLGTHIQFLCEITDAETVAGGAPMTYAYYHKNVKPKPQPVVKKGFRCTVCGYVYEGDVLPADFICPICKHGAEAFVKI